MSNPSDVDGGGADGRSLPAALRGGVGFLTRLPVGAGEREWEAFRRSPFAFPPVGYLVGALAGVALLLPLPIPTAAAAYVAALYLLTGVTHADGLADVGDAAAVHGDADRRRAALKDSSIGVGGALALGATLVVLALGAFGLAGLGGAALAFRVALAAEVGAKLGMALLVCYGRPAHEGLGSALVGEADPSSFGPALLLAVPVLLAPPWPGGAAPLAALVAGPAVALLVMRWSRAALGGVSGDVLGAANELGRAVALHAGLVALVVSP